MSKIATSKIAYAFKKSPVRWMIGLLGIVLVVVVVVLALNTYRPDPEPLVVIRTAHERYVSELGEDESRQLTAASSELEEASEFRLICLEDGKAAFQTVDGTEDLDRYVSAMAEDFDWVLMAETDVLDSFETFTLIDVNSEEALPCPAAVQSLLEEGEVTVALLTWHNRYVTAMDWDWDPSWVLRGETGELLGSERFTLLNHE